ncbi:MAG: sensor hybrid histidine kinase [Gammaproteobacteria bacterium]|nr:sensor hybrid histidine kinase [Gammaproteobacteria bacterium]
MLGMMSNRATRVSRSSAQYFFGGMGLALLTLVGVLLGLDFATASFRIASAQQIVLAITFVLTSLIVTRLVGRARRQTRVALQAEAALRSSEARLAEAQRLSLTGSFSWCSSTGELLWSEETFRIYEYDATTKPTWELVLQRVHPQEAALAKQTLERASQQVQDFDFERRLLMPDGRVKHIHILAHALRDSSGDLEYRGAVMDVTASKQTEEALRRSEEQWRDVFENNPTMYFMVGAAGRIMAVNPFGAEQLGYRVDELAGEPVLMLFHEPDREVVRRNVAICFEELGRARSWEARKICKDGTVLWVRETAKAVPRVDGPIVLIACEDVTERKQFEAEKERLEAQLRQSQKMEAMGALAGGIAHDFNNILAAILGYGELAEKVAPEGSPVRRYVDNMMHAGGRGKSLVERILAFSRSGLVDRGPINVQAVIEEALELIAASLAPGIVLEKRLEVGNVAVIGDATQLHQVAMNLCTNAVQAMEHGGVLEVALECDDVAQRCRLSHGDLAPGVYVRLCVSDTGGGIPPYVLDRMFDPFFTTKHAGEGTGLGLSLVHGIVMDLGGSIDVRTTVGRGTTFTIWLPVGGEAAVPSAEIATEIPRGNGESVMVVDDEKSLVALAEEVLAEIGYEPVGFSSSRVALEAFRATPQRFDIVLTEEMMPDLMGTDLAREIRLLRPDIPIVLTSGYSGAPLHERASAAAIQEVLRKPLRSKDIAECFGRVLR